MFEEGNNIKNLKELIFNQPTAFVEANRLFGIMGSTKGKEDRWIR